MKPLILICQAVLFIAGSYIIYIDYIDNGPDATIVGWTGAILIVIAVILFLPLATLFSKIKKK